jgi:hypothetical protein
MCCKVLPIAALEKPEQSWRTHCDIGKGCRIYADGRMIAAPSIAAGCSTPISAITGGRATAAW